MRLSVAEAGAGTCTPVVLLHGLFGAGRNFGAVQRALSATRRVLAPDLRNHGDSPRDARMDYAAMAADVAETLRDHGARPAAVVGHSIGGKAAMMLALTDPAAVERLVVCDIAPAPSPGGLVAYVEALRAIPLRPGLARRDADAALAPAIPEAGIRAFLLSNLVTGTGDAPPRWRVDLDAVAAAMPTLEGWEPPPPGARPYGGPTLVLRGGRSPYVRPEHEPLFRALFPRARFATVEGAGHWVHADDPAGFLSAVGAFLDE